MLSAIKVSPSCNGIAVKSLKPGSPVVSPRISLPPSKKGRCGKFVHDESKSSASVTKPYRILCYGDSNTAGFRGINKAYTPYGHQLADTLRLAGISCEVTSVGLCGFTSEGLVNDIDARLIQPKVGPSGEGLALMLRESDFDLVVIMIGTNDLGRRMDPMVTLSFVTRLHNTCHAAGIPTVNIVPPSVSTISKHPLAKAIRESRKQLAEVMNTWAKDVPQILLSLDCETVAPKSMAQFYEPDDIHLSAQGSKKLAQGLAMQLSKVLKQLPQQRQALFCTSAAIRNIEAVGDAAIKSLEAVGDTAIKSGTGSPLQVQRITLPCNKPVGYVTTVQNHVAGMFRACGRTSVVGIWGGRHPWCY